MEGDLLYSIAHMHAIYLFPVIFGFSLLGSYLGTYLTKPTDISVLKSFYKEVKPWGLWKPVVNQLKSEDSGFEKNNDFWMDMANCLVGIIWQSSMILLPIYLVIRDYPKTLVALIVFIITSIILKYTWLNKVQKIPN